MRKHAPLIGAGLLLTVLFIGAAANIYHLPLVEQLDAIAYDSRLRLTMPGSIDERIVILDIDEKSLKEEGRWPWSRDHMAQLLDKLFDRYGIAIAGFDVVFAERDESSGLKTLQEIGNTQLRDVPQFQTALDRLRPQLEYDKQFARSMKGRKVVLGYYFTVDDSHSKANASGQLPAPALPPGSFGNRRPSFIHWDGYGGNLPELQDSAYSAGHFDPLVDADGIVRRIPMLVEYQGAYYESLSLAVVRALLNGAKLSPGYAGDAQGNDDSLEWLNLQTAKLDLQIPVDRHISTLVPYRGSRGSFRYFSIADALHERIPVEQLHNKIVLIGTTAPGLMDMRSTPVDAVYPGVEVHANMISGILDQNLKQRPTYVMGAEVMLLLLIGGALSLALPLLGPLRAILAAGVTLTAMAGFDIWLWQSANLDLPIANLLLLIILLSALKMSYGYFFESRTKRKITNLFGQYVPSEVVEDMSKNPESVSMEGESREMTILFSDVRSFTTISEGLDPKELSQLMNEFLTPLSRIIYKHRGTIDKYMGDCIMAFWGAPLRDPKHARNAILAGLEMLQELERLQPQFKQRGWPEIHIGVGVNTGKVSVGNMGSEVRVAYTVMGDAVNLASRLEGVTKQYGVSMIVGEATKESVPDLVYRELDQVRVKGKDKPVTIYEPIGIPSAIDSELIEEIKTFHKVLKQYRKQEWDSVELQLYNLQRMSKRSGKLYQVYAERVTYFRNNPPPVDWDGVFTFDTK